MNFIKRIKKNNNNLIINVKLQKKSGGGLIGWYLNGKKVSFSTGQNASSGAWTEYVAVDAKMCIA